MQRPEPHRGVALPIVLGVLLAMGVSMVSVWRELRMQWWTVRLSAAQQASQIAMQALINDAVRDLQSGQAFARHTRPAGCERGICKNLDTTGWGATQWAQQLAGAIRFGEAAAVLDSPLALSSLQDARYWLEAWPYKPSQPVRGGPEPLTPATLYRITAWLPDAGGRSPRVVQALWFQDEGDPRPPPAAGQFTGWREVGE